MLHILVASAEPAAPPHLGLQGELMRRFGFDPIVASLVVVAASALGSLLARWLGSLALSLWERHRYGGWVMRVSGGKSKRCWHMPLDIAIVKSLQTRQYVAFKRDLGTILSGEGSLDFSLGVDQSEPLRAAPPRAKGLVIDFQKRVIEMVFLALPDPSTSSAVKIPQAETATVSAGPPSGN
jgi:hypothetical protein